LWQAGTNHIARRRSDFQNFEGVRHGDFFMQPFHVSKSADLAAVCERLAASNAAPLPLFAAAAARRIALITFTAQSMKWPAVTLAGLTRPTIILIGDDPEIGTGSAAGPMGWKIAERLRRWTRGAIVPIASPACPPPTTPPSMQR
jgi:hypothetical protein